MRNNVVLPTRLVVMAVFATVVAGCGGGGGGSSAPAPNTLPIAAFTASPLNGEVPLPVSFDATTSTDADGTVASWNWAFGDGGTGSGSTISHTYSTPGTYTTTLTITDNSGGTNATSQTITVVPNTPPVAVVRGDVLEGFAPLTVKFNGSASSDAEGPITQYAWNFGNGLIGTVANATTLYTTKGQYTATLTVKDRRNVTSSASTTVYVADKGVDHFALAGVVTLPDTVFADCDTADTVAQGAAAGCNQTVGSAQRIPSPAIVGGYASLAGDSIDRYGVSFAGGETVSLNVSDSNSSNDLDLKLYDSAGAVLIAQSAHGNTALESLVVPSTGSYILQVDAVAGKSNYVLSLGTASAMVGSSTGSAVTGEMIVQFSQLSIPWRFDAQNEARSAQLDVDVVAGNGDMPMLVRDKPGVARARGGLVKDLGRRLRENPDVLWAEPNRVRQPLGLNARDAYFPLQWNLPIAHFPAAWAIDSVRGTGTVVAVIDTGVLLTHPDLVGQLVSGYDFVSDTLSANDGNGIDADPTDPGGDGLLHSTFHGSHVAGIIAANTNFSAPVGTSGIAGAAPLTKIMPVRAIGRYGGTSYDIVQSIRYAAGLSNDSGTVPAHPADVINISFGSTGYSQAEQDAISAARGAGAIIVAAGGNSGDGTIYYPAGYAGVVGVGAVTLDRRRAQYSTTGTAIDIVAPGGDTAADLDGNGYPDGILSTVANDASGTAVMGYDFYQGTSMATPHVAAVAAMMKALLPTLTPASFDTLLAAGSLTRDLGAAGRDDQYGMGILDAEKSLIATGSVTASAALPVVSPVRLGLGAAATQALVVLDNGGGGTLTATGASGNQSWLSVTAQSVDAAGLGSYRISINRGALPAGNYAGTVTFATSAGSIDVPVTMVVDTAVTTVTSGTLYIVVWDPKAHNFVTYTGSTAILPGASSFSLTSLVAGSYQFYVGTDNDNDGLICDPGEACGAWPSMSEPALFAHVRDRTDLSFLVNYTNPLATLSLDVGGQVPLQGIPRR